MMMIDKIRFRHELLQMQRIMLGINSSDLSEIISSSYWQLCRGYV